MFKEPVSFSNINVSDYDSLLTIWEESVIATHDFLSEENIQFFKPLIRNSYFQQVKLTGLRDANNELCGFAGTSDNKLEMLFLHPAAIGKGWGKLLLLQVITQDGIDTVDVNEQNTHALQFYIHNGFKITGRSAVDGMGKPFPLVHLQLNK